MVHLVSLVYPVSLAQPNKPDRRDKPHNGVLILVACFSILLEEIADQLHRLFRRASGMDEIRRETFEQAHPGLIRT